MVYPSFKNLHLVKLVSARLSVRHHFVYALYLEHFLTRFSSNFIKRVYIGEKRSGIVGG